MRHDNWITSRGDRLIEGRGPQVRKIGYDAKPVHFLNHLQSKIREAVVTGFQRARDGPKELHVPQPFLIEILQVFQLAFERPATLKADSHSQLTLLLGPPNIVNA